MKSTIGSMGLLVWMAVAVQAQSVVPLPPFTVYGMAKSWNGRAYSSNDNAIVIAKIGGVITMAQSATAQVQPKAIMDNGQLWLRGFVATADGKEMVSAELRGVVGQVAGDDEALGLQLAAQLRAQGADAILAKLACHA